MLPSSVRYPIEITLLTAAYLAVALIGLAFAIPPGNATAVWPASGVALAAVMLRGNRVWPAIWLGALLANGTTTVSLATAATIASGNTIEALLAAWLCRRWLSRVEAPFQHVEEAFRFAAATGLASIVAATVGGASLVLGGYAPRSAFLANWATWWLGDVAGLMIVVPLVLACAKPGARPWGRTRRPELVVLFALMALASQAIFGGWLSEQVAEQVLYIPLIFLVWVCLRFELAEVTLATALFSGFAIAGTSAGLGPFQSVPVPRSLFHLQMFMNLYALTGLAFAAVVAGRRASEHRLERARTELEQIVADRTHALTVANTALRQEMAERQAAEQNLRERESRYRELIQNLHVGVVIHAPDTSILLSNDRAAELLGVTAFNMPGKTDHDSAWSFVREDGTDMPADEYPVNRVLATRQPLRDLVCGINRPGGDRRWVVVNALPEFGATQELTSVVVTFMDITERRRLEELERLRLDSALEAIGDGILITDADGDVQYVNPAFERVTGYSRPEIIGHNPRLLQSGQHDQAFYRTMWRTLAGGESWHGEFVDRRKDGKLYDAETTITRIRDDAGSAIGYVGVQRDVSDRKRAAAVTEQLRLARTIQQRFFPRTSPAIAGFDIGGASYPADETGGDYYDYFQLPRGRLGVVLGDASGHGIGPALVMSQMRAYLQALLALDLDVSDLATRLNSFLLADGHDERFVTLFLAQLDPRDASFVYASAGHRCYLLGPGDEVQRLDATAIPLGIMPVTVPSAAPRTLRAGQIVLFLTDGVDDTLSPEGEPFGIERALDVVRANRHRPASEIVDTLYRSARSFAQDLRQQDDITAVVLKVEAAATVPPE